MGATCVFREVSTTLAPSTDEPNGGGGGGSFDKPGQSLANTAAATKDKSDVTEFKSKSEPQVMNY